MAIGWDTDPLREDHDLGHLNSGRPEIDDWLSKQAVRLQKDCTVTTHVWTDNQSPFVYGFYSLTPYRLQPDDETRASGYTGGALSGYMIAKIGLDQRAAKETRTIEHDDGSTFAMPIPALLVIDALVDMEHAAGTAGGKWAFIDTTNEPAWLLEVLDEIGFKPINSSGSPVHFLKLLASHSSISSASAN